MTYEEAKFILRHGSAEGIHNYLKAIKVIENEITRQKEEIERLTAMVEAEEDYMNPLPFKNAFDKEIEKAKSEARREFADRLEPKLANNTDITGVGYQSVIEDIDNLLKEMESESDA